MKRLIALGALVVVILSYFLGGLIGFLVGAVIVAATLLSYLVGGERGLVRAILIVAFILLFLIGGFVGRTVIPKLPGRMARIDQAVLFIVGGAIGLLSWLLVLLTAFFLCSEIIFVSHGGDRWGSFAYLVNSLLLGRAGALEIVDSGELRTIKSGGLLAPFRAIGYTIIYHGNAAVFERFGRPSQVVGPSLVVKKPFETIRVVVDLTMQIETRTEMFFTRDGIPLTIDVKVFFQIDSGERLPTAEDKFPFSEEAVLNAVYIVPDWKAYTVEATLALLRDMVVRYYLVEIFDPLKKLSEKDVETLVQSWHDKLHASLSELARTWGVKIHRVELDIKVPEEVEEQALAFEKARVERALAFEEAEMEQKIELQRAEAEHKRIKQFMSRTGASITDYVLLRYLEKIGEAGLIPPQLERMFLDAINKEGTD